MIAGAELSVLGAVAGIGTQGCRAPQPDLPAAAAGASEAPALERGITS